MVIFVAFNILCEKCLLTSALRCFFLAFFPSSLRGRFCGHTDVSKQFDAVNGVVCKVLGCSGKIMCVHPNYKREKIDFSDDNKDRILIEFDSLQVSTFSSEYFLPLNILQGRMTLLKPNLVLNHFGSDT